MQMVGVAQHHLTFQMVGQIVRGNRTLDRTAGRDVHKSRGLHGTVRRDEFTPSGGPFGC